MRSGSCAPHLRVADGYEGEGQQVPEHEGAHHVDLPLVVGPDLPAERGVVPPLHDALVVRHGSCHHQGQAPDQHHAEQRVPRHPDRRGLPGVHDGHVAVHGHRGQREDADQHGHGEEVVDELADEGAQHPGGQHVDGGLEGDAEEQVGQVRHAQVQDEDVGRAPRLTRLAARQHRDDHGVPDRTQDEDQSKYEQGDEVVYPHPQGELSRQPRGAGVRGHMTLVLHLQLHGVNWLRRSYMLM